MIFTSYRTGSPQLFEASLPDGEIRQLTDGAADSSFLAGNFRRKHLFRARRIGLADRIARRLSETEVVRFENAQLGECSLSADGEWITAAIKQGAQAGIVTGRADGTSWRLIPFGRTVIHPQFHPLEPEWLIFAGDPAPQNVSRAARRNAEWNVCMSTAMTNSSCMRRSSGEQAEIVFTVWPRLLCRMDWTTREIREITQFNAWHIASNKAGTQVLCDTNHPDRGIFLIDVATGDAAPGLHAGFEQWRIAVARIAICSGRGLRASAFGGEDGRNAELDGSIDRHCLRTAMDTSASVVLLR